MRGREILRTSPVGGSKKFVAEAAKIAHLGDTLRLAGWLWYTDSAYHGCDHVCEEVWQAAQPAQPKE